MTAPATLAYLGDAVFELLVREMLLAQNSGGTSPNVLTRRARTYVSASAQATMYHEIFPHLTEEEQAIMKRGRNLHSASRAKNADATAYRHATGLETLFGFLHEKGEHARISDLFARCTETVDK